MNQVGADRIVIKGLEIFAHHGVLDFEKKDGQKFYVDAVLYSDLRPAGMSDALKDSTNYADVCAFITECLQENTYDLIERAAEKAAEGILQKFPLIKKVDFTLHKPNAPIDLPFEDVAVTIERGWHKVYVAFGSNMGEKEDYIAMALKELEMNPMNRMEKVSKIIETKPYGGVEQDNFLNGVCALETLYMPEELLDELHRMEALANRERTLRWGPRTLDLDIIFYDDLIYHSDTLCIPHQDMENRDFVLEPMAEIAPYFHHPVSGKTMEQMLKELKIR